MTDKRFTITQKEDYFYVRDEVNKKPMGMFEFKQDEFPVYFCFHKIIDLLNEQHEEIKELQRHLDLMRCGALTDDKRIKELYDENEQLKQDNNALIHLLENQSMIIQELHSKLLEYQIQEPIVLTKEDLELMGKAISYYTHGRCGE